MYVHWPLHLRTLYFLTVDTRRLYCKTFASIPPLLLQFCTTKPRPSRQRGPQSRSLLFRFRSVIAEHGEIFYGILPMPSETPWLKIASILFILLYDIVICFCLTYLNLILQNMKVNNEVLYDLNLNHSLFINLIWNSQITKEAISIRRNKINET